MSYTAAVIVEKFHWYIDGTIDAEEFEDSIYEILLEEPISRGLRSSLEQMDYMHRNIRTERVLQDLMGKLDMVDINKLEQFVDEL